MQIVIPSKGRADIIAGRTLKWFPDAIVSVGEDEVDAYSNVVAKDKLLVHPANVVGIGPLRQWILDNVADPVVYMIDDDLKQLYDQTGFKKRRITDPAEAQAIVERVAIVAQDAGARVFGFQICARPIAYRPFDPYHLNAWVGGSIGIIGRELRYDTSLLLRADIDFCLKSLMRDRIVMVDGRFDFAYDLFAGSGGGAKLRSQERHQTEIKYLLKRWGKYLHTRESATQIHFGIKVPRRAK
ncbi:MAG: hypothetical protein JEZ07_12240 [Phycisphaerae bacterium]|nr:hypothetical protein [Phycisphaerae bacterium]